MPAGPADARVPDAAFERRRTPGYRVRRGEKAGWRQRCEGKVMARYKTGTRPMVTLERRVHPRRTGALVAALTSLVLSEIVRGRAATRDVRAMLQGRLVTIDRVGRSYNRTVARVRFDGRDLGETLVAMNVARPWPHHAPKPDWCPRYR